MELAKKNQTQQVVENLVDSSFYHEFDSYNPERGHIPTLWEYVREVNSSVKIPLKAVHQLMVRLQEEGVTDEDDTFKFAITAFESSLRVWDGLDKAFKFDYMDAKKLEEESKETKAD